MSAIGVNYLDVKEEAVENIKIEEINDPDVDSLGPSEMSTNNSCSNPERWMPEIKIEDVKFEEPFHDDRGLHTRKTFPEETEDNRSNSVICGIEIKSEQHRNIHECGSNIENNCSLIKLEDVDIEEQFVDEKNVYNRKALPIKNEKNLTNCTGNKTENIVDARSANPDLDTESAHSNIKSYRCKICEFASTTNYYLKKHMDSVHLKIIKTYRCADCVYTSSFKSNLARHIATMHYEIKQHRCTMCDYVASSKTYIKKHIQSVHWKIKNHSCSMCEYRAVSEEEVKRHLDSVHLKTKNYQCDRCAYAASSKEIITRHIAYVHLKIRNHRCDMCEYAGATKQKLRMHVEAVHLKMKNFRCTICDYAGVSKMHLNSHMNHRHW